MDDVSFCKLPNDNGSDFLRVQVEWSLFAFRINILENNVVWCGKFSSEEVTLFSSNLGMSPDDYMSITRSALSTQGGANQFVYIIEDDKFMWKRTVDDNMHLMHRFGSIHLEVVPTFEMIDCMIDAVIDLNGSLYNKITCLEEEKKALASENQQLSNHLTLFIQKKKEMEKTLYSKFLEILNAKKRKIISLQEELDQSSTSKEVDKQANQPIKSSKTIKTCNKITNYKGGKNLVSTLESSEDKQKLQNLESNLESSKDKQKLQNSESTSESSKQKRKLPEAANNNHYDSETEIDSDTDIESEISNPILQLGASSTRDIMENELPVPNFTKRMKSDAIRRSMEPITESVAETSVSSTTLSVDRETRREHNASLLFDLIGL